MRPGETAHQRPSPIRRSFRQIRSVLAHSDKSTLPARMTPREKQKTYRLSRRPRSALPATRIQHQVSDRQRVDPVPLSSRVQGPLFLETASLRTPAPAPSPDDSFPGAICTNGPLWVHVGPPPPLVHRPRPAGPVFPLAFAKGEQRSDLLCSRSVGPTKNHAAPRSLTLGNNSPQASKFPPAFLDNLDVL